MTNAPSSKDMLSDDYRRQLEEKHVSNDAWGTTGVQHYNTIIEMVDLFQAESVLDYGCGKGALGERFREEQKKPGSKYAKIEFLEYDPGIPGKDSMDSTGDILVNIDVLEHIEPEYIDNVLADIARRTKRAAFFLISCVPARQLLPDGRNAHLIVEQPRWWIEKLKKYFLIGNAEFIQNNEFHVIALAKDFIIKPDPLAEKKLLNEEEKTVKKAQNHIENEQFARARALLMGIKNFQAAPEALFVLGDLHYRTDDVIKAATYYLEYGKLTKSAKGYRMAGIALSKVENYEMGRKCLELDICRNIYRDDDDYREALMLCWVKTFNPQAAVDLYESRFDNMLMHTVIYIDAQLVLQNLQQAFIAGEQLVKDYPNKAESWSALERVYTALKQFDKALEVSKKAAEIEPENAVYQCNLGLCHLSNAHVEEALAHFNRATEIDRLMMAPYLNRSTIHRFKKDFTHLADDLNKAYQLDPSSADVHYGIGVAAIRQDQYEKAFAELEWYWHKNSKMTSHRMPASMPRWYGEDLTGKTIMFYADQGIGDIIMMMRYVPDLVAKYNPKKLVINVNAKMEALFTVSFPELFANGTAEIYNAVENINQTAIDCIVAATTLPHIFGSKIDTLPHTDLYLKKDKTFDYKKDSGKEFVVGISWFTKSLDAGYIRSLRLMDFAFLSKYKNVRVIDLQYGDTSAERAEAAANGFDVYHDDSVDSWIAMQPFMDQLAACDLIISIDNTTVHAAGAMGIPCWTILAQEPFWRWPTRGDATPWYKSLRLFRQKSKAYTELFDEIETEFKKFLNGDHSVLTGPAFKSAFPPETRPAKTAVLLNDTASYFSWGNWASLNGIKEALHKKDYTVIGIPTLELNWFASSLPTLQDFDNPRFLASCRYRDPTMFAALERADEVIINGEGMMNNAGEAAIKLLYLAYISKHFYGRKVSIINHSCYPEDKPSLSDPKKLAFYHKVYTKLDACVVRDPISYDLLKSIGVNVTLGLDASLLWLEEHLTSAPEIEKTKKVIISGGPGYDSRAAELFADLCKKLNRDGLEPVLLTGAEWHISQEEHALGKDLKELAEGAVTIITAKSMEEFMQILLSAKAVISGFHQTCLIAYAAGTPVIPFTTGTNALTGTGLSKTIDFPQTIFYEDPNALKKLRDAMKNIPLNSNPSKLERASRIEKLADLARKNVNFY